MASKMGQLLIDLSILSCTSFRLEKLRSYIRRSLMSQSIKTTDYGGGDRELDTLFPMSKRTVRSPLAYHWPSPCSMAYFVQVDDKCSKVHCTVNLR